MLVWPNQWINDVNFKVIQWASTFSMYTWGTQLWSSGGPKCPQAGAVAPMEFENFLDNTLKVSTLLFNFFT